MSLLLLGAGPGVDDSGPPPDPPSAEFSGNNLTGTAPLSVDFTDMSSGTPTSWTWERSLTGEAVWEEFSTDQNPAGVAMEVGTWDIRLTVTNAGGSDDETKVAYIEATPPE